jgi:glyoxylase-like metal-dependent hydrolase (beta-lactamase superfamily II)
LTDFPKVEPDIETEGAVDLSPWGVSAKIVETFGHSDGCISIVTDRREAIVGDFLVVDSDCPPAPTLAYFTYKSDLKAANTEILKSAGILLESADKFYSGHGGPFTREQFIAAIEKG